MDIFVLKAQASALNLRNRSIPVEASPLAPTCANIGCDEFLTSDTGTQCIECRTAPAIIAVTQQPCDGLTPRLHAQVGRDWCRMCGQPFAVETPEGG